MNNDDGILKKEFLIGRMISLKLTLLEQLHSLNKNIKTVQKELEVLKNE